LDVTGFFNYQNPWHRHLRLWSYPLSEEITLSLAGPWDTSTNQTRAGTGV
jgi:hypothetical protein